MTAQLQAWVLSEYRLYQRLGPVWTFLYVQPKMSKNTRFLLISLPASISPSNDHDEALTALRSAVTTDYGTVFPFSIPEFKIGTLDALVQQADELAKLEAGCEAVVGKVGDSLRTILEGDEGKIAQQKTVNDSQSGSLGDN